MSPPTSAETSLCIGDSLSSCWQSQKVPAKYCLKECMVFARLAMSACGHRLSDPSRYAEVERPSVGGLEHKVQQVAPSSANSSASSSAHVLPHLWACPWRSLKQSGSCALLRTGLNKCLTKVSVNVAAFAVINHFLLKLFSILSLFLLHQLQLDNVPSSQF
jgi:hypothetical protein